MKKTHIIPGVLMLNLLLKKPCYSSRYFPFLHTINYSFTKTRVNNIIAFLKDQYSQDQTACWAYVSEGQGRWWVRITVNKKEMSPFGLLSKSGENNYTVIFISL